MEKTKRFAWLWILWVGFLLGAFSAEGAEKPDPAPDLMEGCHVLAQELSRNIPHGKSVAVRRFASVGGVSTLLGVRIQDLMTGALSALPNRKFQVVERLRMAELDLERMTHGPSRGGDLDRWARALRADLIVTGTYGAEGGRLILDARLLDPDTGRSLKAARARLPFTAAVERLFRTPAPKNPVAGVFEAVVAPERNGNPPGRFMRLLRFQDGRTLSPPSEKAPVYRVGERMGFSIRPPMDCRLYVFNYDPQGNDASVIFVYPLPQVRPRVFKGGRVYPFPQCVDPRAVSYPVEPPPGRMVFKVIGVDPSAEADLVKGLDKRAGYYRLHQKDLKTLIQGLTMLPAAAWWEETMDFWVVE